MGAKQSTESDTIELSTESDANSIKVPITIECQRNNAFNHQFDLTVPYDATNNYNIYQLILDIMKVVQNQHKPFKFVPIEIRSDSFIGQQINFNDYDWNDCQVKITDYDKNYVVMIGVHLFIDMSPYKHIISSDHMICKDMKNDDTFCSIYAKMRYQDIFTEGYLNHLYEYNHFIEKSKCKYGDECFAYKRLSNDGGNALKDRCHVQIYRHPPRGRKVKSSEEINSFSLNDEWAENAALYHPQHDEIKYNENGQDGFLQPLIEELIANGFKSDLYLNIDDEKNNNYSIMNIVNQKLKCIRHKQMGLPLNKAEMLAIVLYTGCGCNYDLCKSQRNGDYLKWKWFDLCLYNAINKLSKREYGHYKIYTGLTDTKLEYKYVDCGYFKTYISTSWVKQIAMTFVQNQGMIFEIDETFREKAMCCDVSWISKFGQNECEILIARSIDAVLNCFECEVVDDRNQIQTVSLRLYKDKQQHINTQNRNSMKNDGPLKFIELSERREDEKAMVLTLEDDGAKQDCILSMKWVNQWRSFVHNKTDVVPGKIDNNYLIENQELKKDLEKDIGYNRVPSDIYQFLVETYGGGPKIHQNINKYYRGGPKIHHSINKKLFKKWTKEDELLINGFINIFANKIVPKTIIQKICDYYVGILHINNFENVKNVTFVWDFNSYFLNSNYYILKSSEFSIKGCIFHVSLMMIGDTEKIYIFTTCTLSDITANISIKKISYKVKCAEMAYNDETIELYLKKESIPFEMKSKDFGFKIDDFKSFTFEFCVKIWEI